MIAAQERRVVELERAQPDAIVVVESALIFTTPHGVGAEPWRSRFDTIVVVTAPDKVKVRRFVDRVAKGRSLGALERETLVRDAEQRLAAQRIPEACLRECRILENDGKLENLERKTERLWAELQAFKQKGGTKNPPVP